jgi:hypothetical protein
MRNDFVCLRGVFIAVPQLIIVEGLLHTEHVILFPEGEQQIRPVHQRPATCRKIRTVAGCGHHDAPDETGLA